MMIAEEFPETLENLEDELLGGDAEKAARMALKDGT